MGNLNSCDKCDIADSSVIQLSDRLVLKLTKGIQPPVEEEEESVRKGMEHEYESMEKLHCFDNSHSSAYGLNVQGFETQRSNMLKFLSEHKMHTESRAKDLLVACLRENPNCAMKCFREMEEYMDSIDARRMTILKEKKDSDMSRIKKL